MADLSPLVWLVIGGVSAWAALGTLYVLAIRMSQEIDLHNLAVESRKLHNAYVRRMQRGGACDDDEALGVDIVEDDGPVEAAEIVETPARKAA